MVRNPRKKSTSDPDTKATAGTESQFSGSVHDSARQIWQAGLGAFTRAQADGSKAFEALAQEGVSIQRKTQAAAEEQLAQASSRMSSMANDISNKASGQWDKLESIFEDRVAKALGKLGIPSAKDVQALIDRIDQLHAAVQQISPQTPVSKVARQPASKAAATGKAKAKTSAKKSLPKA